MRGLTYSGPLQRDEIRRPQPGLALSYHPVLATSHQHTSPCSSNRAGVGNPIRRSRRSGGGSSADPLIIERVQPFPELLFLFEFGGELSRSAGRK